MSNHVHLLLKCNKKEPGHFMRMINSKYTRYFNIKYDYVGHLFQGRYHAEPITNINQLLETSRYIHLNPVRAKIVSIPEKYRWSSYKAYINKLVEWSTRKSSEFKTIINDDIYKQEVLNYFTNANEYAEYVNAPGEWE